MFVNADTTMVKKELPMYVDGNVNVNAIAELSVLRSFGEGIDGIPRLQTHSIEKDTSKIIMTMPFYGRPLNIMKLSDSYKKVVATTLVKILCDLERKGIQHTDLKPSNVLVTRRGDVTLIDFNNVSYLCDDKWSRGYGTWSYAAPEIVNGSRPSHTSSVWSLGILIAYMYGGGHPFVNTKQHTLDTLSSRGFWKKTLKDLQHTYSDGIVLHPGHVAAIPPDLLTLIQKCTRWKWKDRICMTDIYRELVGCASIDPYVVPTAATTDYDACIQNACEETHTTFVKTHIQSLVARISPCTPLHACVCHIIILMLMGSYVFDDGDLVSTLRTAYNILEEAEALKDMVWDVGEAVEWKLLHT